MAIEIAPHAPVEGQLAGEHQPPMPLRFNRPVGQKQPHRDRQVVHRPFLLHVGGREVDQQPVQRKRIAGVRDRRANPLDGFLHPGIGQPDDRRLMNPPLGKVDLDLASNRIDPLEHEAMDLCKHGVSIPPIPSARDRSSRAQNKWPGPPRQKPAMTMPRGRGPAPHGRTIRHATAAILMLLVAIALPWSSSTASTAPRQG
jgi:hypothetical protein